MDYGQNIFTAMIDETGTIWEASTGRKRQSVGIDAQKEQEYIAQIAEMQERLDQYYAKLVDLGIISPPKSAEQIAQEQAAQQAEINAKLLEAIGNLQTELGELRKNGDAGNGAAIGRKSIGQDSESDWEKSAASKGSNKPRKKIDPGDSEQSDS